MYLTALEKKIVIFGVFAIMISTTTVYLFQDSVATWLGLNESINQSSVQNNLPSKKEIIIPNVTPTEKVFGAIPLTAGPATISVKVEDSGVAGIWLDLKSPYRISGIELTFSVSDSLQIENVVCEKKFVCITNQIVNNKLVLAGYRPLNKIDVVLKKSVKIATVKYSSIANTTSELILNYKISKPSLITQSDTGKNLLSNSLHIYSLGKPQ